MKRLAALLAPLALAACAPQALYFHETTKVAFAADYNPSDSQPIASSFGFKRRIVAVVPAQERVSADGTDRHATNEGEALSIVSKFHVRVGTFSEGVVITNNFASGMAARVMTASPRAAETVNALLHNVPIEVSPTTGATRKGMPGPAAANARIAEIMGKRTPASDVPASRRGVDLDDGENLEWKREGATRRGTEDVPASTRSVDLAPDGSVGIKKKKQ